ncbi:hypothetical protein BKA70DRAFT_1400840 [Coprinopsis sp. MPI-PUGE-AT-0042]|nr:hypothetical protein BKA70DRAFT_1400840 [Coprinopsis sp. MPI-PUGE-AT-0042]
MSVSAPCDLDWVGMGWIAVWRSGLQLIYAPLLSHQALYLHLLNGIKHSAFIIRRGNGHLVLAPSVPCVGWVIQGQTPSTPDGFATRTRATTVFLPTLWVLSHSSIWSTPERVCDRLITNANALNLTFHAHDERINVAETGFRDKPHIRQAKKRKGIAYTMRVFPTIPKIQASRPQWHKGCMWAGGGHGGGDEEDEEDTRRQRAHLNTPNSRLGLVTREGGDGFTERRAPSEVSDSILDEARTTTRTKTYLSSTHLDFLERPSADVEANPGKAAPGLATFSTRNSPPGRASQDNHQLLKNAKWRIIGAPITPYNTTRRDDSEGHETCDEAEQDALCLRLLFPSPTRSWGTRRPPFSVQQRIWVPMPVLISLVEEISNPIDPLVRRYRRHQYRLCLSGFLAVPLWFSGYRKKPSVGPPCVDQVKFIMPDPQTHAIGLGIDLVQAEPGHPPKNDRSTPIPCIVVTGVSPTKQDLNDPEYGLMLPSSAWLALCCCLLVSVPFLCFYVLGC